MEHRDGCVTCRDTKCRVGGDVGTCLVELRMAVARRMPTLRYVVDESGVSVSPMELAEERMLR